MLFRITLTLALAWLALSLIVEQVSTPVQALDAPAAPQSPSIDSVQWKLPASLPTDTLVLAHWVGWFGLPTHRMPIPEYRSIDAAAIRRQIAAARSIGIDGFIVDWLGPATGRALSNEADRAFIDQATRSLFAQAQMTTDFKIALMYDYGALTDVHGLSRTQQMSADLAYARATYLTRSIYLTQSNRPVLFLFPYDNVAPDVNLQTATLPLDAISVSLIYKNPTTDTAIQPYVDGFFAWVQPITYAAWQTDGGDWGAGYLTWFHETMTNATSPYSRMLGVGAAWPGFNDTLAPWRTWPPRFIARRGGQTWDDTWRHVLSYHPPIVQIVTWNDWEEGTAIEPGEGLGTWAGTPIDRMDDVTPWTTLQGSQAITVSLAKRAGHDDASIQMSYVLTDSMPVTQDVWVQMKLVSSSLDIREGDLIRFWFSGTPNVTNSLQVGLIESRTGQPIAAADLNQVTQVPFWTYATLSYDAFYPWTTTITQTSGQLEAVFISVVKFSGARALVDVGGAGIIALDGLQYLNSMSRTVPAAYESVVVSPMRAMSAANWIAGQQQPSGLVLSWKEEPQGKAWLYDQALALIVLSDENVMSATKLAARLASLQSPDGFWYDGYQPDAMYFTETKQLTDNAWEGSIAWAVYALTRYAARSGSLTYTTNAISGADWLKSRQSQFGDGRVHTSTEATLDAWWAFQSTGFYGEADRARDYLLNVAWRKDQRRWNRGYHDPVIVLDTQTWGASFAKAVCRPSYGLAALSFAEDTLSTTSFTGTLRGLDGAGPFSVWNEGTAQCVVAGGRGAQSYLDELRRQQGSDGAMPGSPDNFHGGDVWLTSWRGVAPTAWLYFAETGGPFVALPRSCQVYLPIVLKGSGGDS